MSELKKCPFCGGEADYTQILGNYGRVYCFTCDGGIREGRSKDGVIHNWNNRPIEDALQAENEWLKEELQQEKTRSQLNLEAEERRMLNITYYCAEIDRLNARIAELEAAQRWHVVKECNDVATPIDVALRKRIAELEGKIDQLTAHSDIKRQDDKSSNDTQTQTIVYGKEDSEVQE